MSGFNWDNLLIGFVGAILGAMGTWAVGTRMELFRRSIRIRETHLEDLKRAVLKPTFESLKNYYLPVCELKTSFLERRSSPIPRMAGSVLESTTEGYEFVMAIKDPMILSSIYSQDQVRLWIGNSR